jgi:hypothetical protein
MVEREEVDEAFTDRVLTSVVGVLRAAALVPADA